MKKIKKLKRRMFVWKESVRKTNFKVCKRFFCGDFSIFFNFSAIWFPSFFQIFKVFFKKKLRNSKYSAAIKTVQRIMQHSFFNVDIIWANFVESSLPEPPPAAGGLADAVPSSSATDSIASAGLWYSLSPWSTYWACPTPPGLKRHFTGRLTGG